MCNKSTKPFCYAFEGLTRVNTPMGEHMPIGEH